LKIAIITAMQTEYDAVRELHDFSDGKAEIYGNEVYLIKSGMGKVHAAIASERACQKGVDLVINTGLAGGIDSSLEQGDIVLAKRVCYHDAWYGEPNAYGQVQDMPLYYEAPADLISKISQLAPDFRLGLTVTGDQFLTDVDKLKEIKKAFPEALATDMESAAVAQTCHINKVPYMSLRIISDVVGKSGQMEQYENFWQQVPHKATEMIDRVLKVL